MKNELLNLFEFPLDKLRVNEIKRLENWIKNLRSCDIENATTYLNKSYEFFSRLKKANHSNIFIMNSIGSTARLDPDYKDLDFLLLTNGQLPGFEGPISDDFIDNLKPEYSLEAVYPEFFEEYYENLSKLPGRDVQKISPTSMINHPWSSIHQTLQRNVPSESYWTKRDREERVLIYRII